MSNKRQTHGLHTLMRRVNARGIGALDGRTVAVRAVTAWRSALLADLGGEANVSTQRLAIVDSAVRTKLFLDHVDVFLMQQESLVNKKRRSVIPALKERQVLVDSLNRSLSLLGLERQQRAIPTLHEYIAERETKPRGPDEEEPPEIDRDKEPPEATA
jgi:hypothetical protein